MSPARDLRRREGSGGNVVLCAHSRSSLNAPVSSDLGSEQGRPGQHSGGSRAALRWEDVGDSSAHGWSAVGPETQEGAHSCAVALHQTQPAVSAGAAGGVRTHPPPRAQPPLGLCRGSCARMLRARGPRRRRRAEERDSAEAASVPQQRSGRSGDLQAGMTRRETRAAAEGTEQS